MWQNSNSKVIRRFCLILSTLCCLYSYSFSQGQINNYLFGYDNWPKALLDFPNNVPSVNIDSNISLRFRDTHANISDSVGNLLFYTNGFVLMDSNHDTMPNGTGLNPCQFTTQLLYDGLPLPQADLILPDPGNISIYYLIHQSLENDGDLTNNNLYFSKIDMVLNNWKGDVFQKNISIFQDTLWGGGTTACRHANGRDWWIIAVRAHLPVYFVFLLTPSGISYSSTQTIGSRWDYGQAAFSEDGNYYGIREYRKNFQVFDFDRCSGLFSNARIVLTNDSNVGIGFCFSPNSRLAYATSAHFLYQVNLDSVNLSASLDTVAMWDTTFSPNPPFQTGFDYMQIGPDGKIYMTTNWATQRMHYINYPDSLGISCGMQQHALVLPTYNDHTIPNFINYFLGPVVGSICDSLGLGIPEHALHDFKFSIQPNPLSEKVLHCKYVLPQSASGGKAGVLEVLDLTGRILVKEPLPEWSTEQHFRLKVTAGLYLVRITSNHQQSVKKICVE